MAKSFLLKVTKETKSAGKGGLVLLAARAQGGAACPNRITFLKPFFFVSFVAFLFNSVFQRLLTFLKKT
jgi:hypothetical protein